MPNLRESTVNRTPASDIAESSKEWFALAVKPRFDKAVAKALDAKGHETFLPLYKKQHTYGTRLKETELPLFPGYVFCRFSALNKLPILTTPGVIRILGNGNWPITIPETEIASIQTAIKTQLPIQPFPFLQVGRVVRIEQGVLAGVEGIIVKLKQSWRLVLSITLLQRSVLLEVDRDQVGVKRVLQPVSEPVSEEPVQGSHLDVSQAIKTSETCVNREEHHRQ